MNAAQLAKQLVQTLPSSVPGMFNAWTQRCQEDLPDNGPEEKIRRVAAHLDCDARFILCGEAPGYQGHRHTGLAFSSERLVMEGAIPRINAIQHRLTTRRLPYSEPSATIVWRALYELRIQEQVVLWNAVQLHPYKGADFRTNRTPTKEEIALGEPALRMLVQAFPKAQLIAVGQKAQGLMEGMGLQVHATLRHPANGGAIKFATGLAQFVGLAKT